MKDRQKKIDALIEEGGRITAAQGLQLLRESNLLYLARLAQRVRFRLNPLPRVTFVLDTNPNYTNICINECSFCAFFRRTDAPDAYTLSVDELLQKFQSAARKGVKTVLLQGGVNPHLSLDYYLTLIRRTITEVPEIHPHFFSPPEIMGIARNAGLPPREILKLFYEAGLRTMPGGGAEILSERVKSKISPKKGSAEEWLYVMREAHRIGYKTTATMMYGHIEKDRDIIEHLERIRELQDECGGFTAFIPWSFKPANSTLGRGRYKTPSPNRYLRIIALSRIYLDNFPHIQASWFSEGRKIGQIALYFGADDFGGILLEENVHAAANHVNAITKEECIALIHQAGFAAAERDTFYNILKIYPLTARKNTEEGIDYPSSV